MMVFSNLDCTRIGRYAGGEIKDATSSHPIIQFLVNPYYEDELYLEFEHKGGCFCAEVPKKAKPKAPRITKFKGDKVRVLDVGCSSGANLLLLEDLLSKATDKEVEVRGYDNDKRTVKKTKKGKMAYESRKALLHPVVNELVERYFDFMETVQSKWHFKNGDRTTTQIDEGNLYSIRSEALQRLQKLLSFCDAKELPKKDNSVDVAICLYVLRYNDVKDQWKIFRELIRVTKPGGYIFTEEFFFRRGRENDYFEEKRTGRKYEKEGVTVLYPKLNVATSFYDKRKALWYNSGGGEFSHEAIWPVSGLEEIDKILSEFK